MNNLKPCPFCGIPVSSKDHGRYIICNDAECILGGDWIDTIGCINNWNKRYTEDKLRAEVERLRGVVGETIGTLLWQTDLGCKCNLCMKYRQASDRLERILVETETE